MDFTSDLAMLYADFGKPATHHKLAGGADVVGQAILDEPGMTVIGGEVLATDFSLRYPAATFPVVRRGDTFAIGGITYTAREAAQPVSVDGLEYIVPLAKA